MQCKGCGAALAGSPTASSWICNYCKTVNVNEHFLSVYAKNTDFTKSAKILEIAMAAFEADDFLRAFGKFEEVTEEDPTNIDAWSYGAVCSARMATAQNIDELAKTTFVWLQRAASIDAHAEVYVVANGVCRDELAATALRAIQRHFREGNDAYYAFRSTDNDLALKKQLNCFDRAYHIATKIFEMPPENSSLLGRIAFEVLSNTARLPRGTALPECADHARGALEVVKLVNPDLAREIELSLSSTTGGDRRISVPNVFLVAAWLHVLGGLFGILPADICFIVGQIMYTNQLRPLPKVSNAVKRIFIMDGIFMLSIFMKFLIPIPFTLVTFDIAAVIDIVLAIVVLVVIIQAWVNERSM